MCIRDRYKYKYKYKSTKTMIPLALMASESIAHSALGSMGLREILDLVLNLQTKRLKKRPGGSGHKSDLVRKGHGSLLQERWYATSSYTLNYF